MNNLKQIVANSLELRGVEQKVIDSVDTLIKRSLLRLSKNDILPPRTWEFTSGEHKQQKTLGEQSYNFYKLPEDWRSLESFYVYDTPPYFWVKDDQTLIRNKVESDTNTPRREFTIIHENLDEDSKVQRWLVAFPFPDDDDKVRLKYYTNGMGDSYEWLDSVYWEMVISQVESILGLVSPQEADLHKAQAIKTNKETKGNKEQGFTRVASSYFGGQPYKTRRQFRTDNNI